MSSTSVILLAVGLVIGVVAGMLISRAMARAQAGQQDAELRLAIGRASDAEKALADARTDTARAQTEAANARADVARNSAEAAQGRERIAQAEAKMHAALEAKAVAEATVAKALAERSAALAEAEEIRASRDEMVTQFKLLSTETMEKQGKQADEAAAQRLARTEQVMAPVAQALQLMNQRLTNVEKERAEIAAELRQQVTTVSQTSESLRKETQALVTALRKPQVRGAWGETQLKKVAEFAGLVERCDFETQVSTATTDGLMRPDMRVNLADGKVLFVDAKTPLSSFIDAFETDDPDAQRAHLQSFARNVRTHIDQLGAKNYWQLDLASPEMVILFLPSDALLQAALDEMPDLHEYAARRNLFLASPSILIPLLRAVQHGWKQAALAESAAEIATLGRELYERLGTMGSYLDKLGRSLTSAVKSYNQTVSSLETRVLVTARKLGSTALTDEPLSRVSPSTESIKQMTADELVTNAAAADASLGHLPRAELTAHVDPATHAV